QTHAPRRPPSPGSTPVPPAASWSGRATAGCLHRHRPRRATARRGPSTVATCGARPRRRAAVVCSTYPVAAPVRRGRARQSGVLVDPVEGLRDGLGPVAQQALDLGGVHLRAPPRVLGPVLADLVGRLPVFDGQT